MAMHNGDREHQPYEDCAHDRAAEAVKDKGQTPTVLAGQPSDHTRMIDQLYAVPYTCYSVGQLGLSRGHPRATGSTADLAMPTS